MTDSEAVLQVRRDKLLALWVAGKLGKRGADAEAYADEVAKADDVLHKLGNDLSKARVNMSRAELCAMAEKFHKQARQSN